MVGAALSGVDVETGFYLDTSTCWPWLNEVVNLGGWRCGAMKGDTLPVDLSAWFWAGLCPAAAVGGRW